MPINATNALSFVLATAVRDLAGLLAGGAAATGASTAAWSSAVAFFDEQEKQFISTITTQEVDYILNCLGYVRTL